MGVYGPVPLRGGPTLVLCFDPDLEGTRVDDPGPLAIAADAPFSIPGVTPALTLGLRGLQPWRLDAGLAALGPRQVVVHSVRRMTPGPILSAIRHGAEWFHLVDAPGSSFLVNARGALVLASARSTRRQLASLPGSRRLERWLGIPLNDPWPDLGATVRSAAAASELAGTRAHRPLPAGPLRIDHYIGHLGPGGAERQLTYLALASRAAGHRVRVLTTHPLEGESAHYAEELRSGGVECLWVGVANSRRYPLELYDLQGTPLPDDLVADLRDHLAAPNLFALRAALDRSPPQVLHCWLDESNALGGVAGLLAGVPRVLVSTRNLNPTHFAFDRPWFAPTYAALARSDRVRLIANSRAGAEDYATWCGSDPQAFRVIENGFDADAVTPTTPAERARVRRELGVDPAAFLVVGVFRLAPEKRPLEFLQVLARAASRSPALQAIHVGVGPLAGVVQAETAALGLEGRLRLLGRRADPWSIIGAADAALLCSDAEGCPNVSLESQALQVPIVLTRAGGAAETIQDRVTGFACDVGDVEGLTERLLELARDPGRRVEMGLAGRAWVKQQFSVQRMVERHLGLYRA